MATWRGVWSALRSKTGHFSTDHGHDQEALDRDLALAVRQNTPMQLIERLLEDGASPCAKVEDFQRSALVEALRQDKLYMVATFLEKTANKLFLREEEVALCQRTAQLVFDRYHQIARRAPRPSEDLDTVLCVLRAEAADRILSHCRTLAQYFAVRNVAQEAENMAS